MKASRAGGDRITNSGIPLHCTNIITQPLRVDLPVAGAVASTLFSSRLITEFVELVMKRA